MNVVDVAVIGGGPAGAATALRLARRGKRVALYEASGYAEARMGETLPPTVNTLLRDLGIDEGLTRLGSLPSFQTAAAWGGDEVEARSFLFDPHGNGWHVDRAGFDRMLAEAAVNAGATPVRSRVRRVVRAPGGFLVDAAEPVLATAVVDATGRAARVSRALGARRDRFDRLVCVSRVMTTGTDEPPVDTFLEAVENGWWYSSPLPGNHRLVGIFTDPPIAVRAGLGTPDGWTAALAATCHLWHLTAARPAAPLRVVSAAGHWLRPCAGPGWLAVGDAALAMDPMSAAGVTSALRTAEAAADTLVDGYPDHYAELVGSLAARYRRMHAAAYARETRFPAAAFWQARRGAPG